MTTVIPRRDNGHPTQGPAPVAREATTDVACVTTNIPPHTARRPGVPRGLLVTADIPPEHSNVTANIPHLEQRRPDPVRSIAERDIRYPTIAAGEGQGVTPDIPRRRSP